MPSSGFHVERLVEQIHVACDAVRAAFGGGVRVDLQILLRQLVTILGAPDGRVAEEETLQTGETIDFRRLSQRSSMDSMEPFFSRPATSSRANAYALSAMFTPLRSPMFSPMVKAPFTCGA